MAETATHPARGPKSIVLWGVLFLSGIAWGATLLFSKLSVATGHPAIGIVFWQTVIGAVLLGLTLVVTRRGLPLGRRQLVFYLICGFLGTAFPHTMSYTYIKNLPVGIASILIAVVPMMTLALSAAIGVERATPMRLAGLALGFAAVLLILVPDASLPEDGQWLWALLPLVTALAYACENVYIAKYLPPGTDAVQTLAGLTLGALFLILPILAVQGTWVDITRFEGPEQAIVAGSALHVIAYLGLVWLIGKAGPVFTAQIGYIVTLSGVFLGLIFLGETLASWAWLSLLLMTAGLSLVSPKHQIKLSST